MKILLVTSSFYPKISPRSFRMTELCKEFCKCGHQVTLVTAAIPERTQFVQDLGCELIDLGTPYPPINTNGSNIISSKFRYFFARGSQVLFEYPAISLMWQVNAAIRDLDGFDLLVSCAQPYPVHWGVAWARGKTKKIAPVWIADCGDPFMLSRFDTFNHPPYFAILEKMFCRRADYISIPAISFKEGFYPEFHNKMVEIPQGFNPDEFSVFRGKLPTRPVRFAYAGMFMPRTRDPSALLAYLCKRNDLDFVFTVFTATPQHIRREFREQLGAKLQINQPIPRNEVIFELSKNHFVLNIGYEPSSTIPSKLMDYWVTGRPILNLPANSIEPSILEQFIFGDYSQAFQIENPDKYRIDRVAEQFTELAKSEPAAANKQVQE